MTDRADALLDGDHRALAKTISAIEGREPGFRDLLADLYPHAGDAHVVGVTGPPGAGKSTLVDGFAGTIRDQDETVGVIAVDPASPFSGGAVLGDRIRMGGSAGDMDTFVRSMSARGAAGGLSTAATDAVTALDAFGKDRVVVETVGAGQSEIDVVRTADTVVVLVPPESGDDVQMLKAGILEIADVFVVNKADLDGVDRTVSHLRELVRSEYEDADWDPPIVETVATDGEGIADVLAAVGDHRDWLAESGRLEAVRRERLAAQIRRLVAADATALVENRIGDDLDAAVDSVLAGEHDPYAVAESRLGPLRDCLDDLEET